MMESEDAPLMYTSAAYERTKRKRHKRNILIAVGLGAVVVILLIIFVSIPTYPAASPTPTVPDPTIPSPTTRSTTPAIIPTTPTLATIPTAQTLATIPTAPTPGRSTVPGATPAPASTTSINTTSSPSPARLLPEEEDPIGYRLKLSPEFRATNNDGTVTIKKSPVVKIKQGKLEGIVMKSRRRAREFFSFFSIPFAKPPVKELRFEPPQPADGWKGIRDASYVRGKCIARSRTKDTVEGTEDCLHVHVATPTLDKKKLPVIVYIYGGAFNGGRATRYDPKFFMDEDVILVFISYRLAAFGHLNTGDSVVRGNLSFKDQVLALKWVKENIKAFGGDASRITLVGNSSGAMTVHAHMLSEMSRGLFHGAISQSGVVMGSNLREAQLDDPGRCTRLLGQEVGCTQNNTRELVQCLKEVDAETIAWVDNPDIFWGLTAEALPEDGDASQVFLKDRPVNLMRNGDFMKIPWIVGINSVEDYAPAYDYLQTEASIRDLNSSWEKTILQGQLGMDSKVDQRLRELYFNGSQVVGRDERYGLADLLSDRQYNHPTRVAGIYHARHSPVYLYYLSLDSGISRTDDSKYDFPPPYGVGHGDELQYFFSSDMFPEVTLNDTRITFSEDMVKIWVSFAATGTPEADGVEPWVPIKAEDEGRFWYQLHERHLRKNVEPFTPRMKFWDSVVEEYQLYT